MFWIFSPLLCFVLYNQLISRFVVMENEDTAIKTLKAIQNQPFKDSVIHARIKNESVLLSINRQIRAITASYSSPLFGMQVGQQGNVFSSFLGASVFSSANMADTSAYEAEQTNFKPAG